MEDHYKKDVIEMSEARDRNAFMRKVTADVWERLADVGFNYTFGDIKNHFKEMMDNPDVIKEVVDVFYNRFISI